MPGKDRQRQLAREKVQRQMAKRAAEARRRRRLQAIAGSAVAVIAVVAVAGFTATKVGGDERKPSPAAKRAPEGCSYDKPQGGPVEQVPRKVKPPPVKGIIKTGKVQVVMKTNRGDITLTLDRAKAPCTVNSFVSLARQKFFDNSPCLRVTTTDYYVLQCGFPGETRDGGPGYAFADEGLPADQETLAPYPAATVAMANARPGTNGSQFFIVYKDTQFPPKYTIFGTVTKGLSVVQAIGQAGSTPAGDGKPKKPVRIQSVQIPT